MVDCVASLFDFHARKFKQSRKEKVILWAHNSHLGDARQTDAGKLRGEWNVGQLVRERFGLTKTFNVGFSTFNGTVTAAKSWDKPANCQKVRNGMYDSYEHVLHTVVEGWEHKDYYMLFRSNHQNAQVDVNLVDSLLKPRYERYIGVIYRPDTEKASHYCRSSLPKEYDAVIFIDKTSALEPIDITIPWQSQYQELSSIVDTDTYPEFDNSTTIDDSLTDWRLNAAREIAQVGVEFMEKKDYHMAIAKLDKALHYAELGLKRFQSNVEVQKLRMELLMIRADAYFNLKMWASVIRDCSTVLNLNPAYNSAHLLIAKAYEEKGLDSVAKHHYDSATKQAAQEWQFVKPLYKERK